MPRGAAVEELLMVLAEEAMTEKLLWLMRRRRMVEEGWDAMASPKDD